ncbi:TetR/AcrR family transcriptional regulator [Oceanicoccus sp. KOV_DT_Chl]|uniref:TetR/AcrR family transcriptional regulator n=1 Tax=Oceanicoccus sp. KOV_DT_Chl TaxID=1904639 RepID=UPI000C7BBAE0|nr:TetR/AcrR family transcriptional regulator [Oceanicoccus sp. KOV_DT_Chl]
MASAAAKKSATTVKSAKGEKARAKLKSAALRVMEQVGYHKMRIVDVTAEAGVASGLFYHYFKDLKSLTLEVLGDFVSHSLQLEDIEKDVPKGDWYERMLAHNRLVVHSYAERPGIMRCLLQLADEDEDFSGLLRQNFIEQLSWLTRQMPKLFPEAAMSEHQSMMVAFTLAGTGEMVLRDYYINREPVLVAEALDAEQMAELITVIFYRGLFLENPPSEKLNYTANLEKVRRRKN